MSISDSSQTENNSQTSETRTVKTTNKHSPKTKSPQQNQFHSKSPVSKSTIKSTTSKSTTSKTTASKASKTTSKSPPSKPESSTSEKTNNSKSSNSNKTKNSHYDDMFSSSRDSKSLEGANIGHGYQAMLPKNSHAKFHSDRKFDNCYETCLWKPPLNTTGADKKYSKDLDTFLKRFQTVNRTHLNEAQILGILMVNNYNMESAAEDLKHYESTLTEDGKLSADKVKKLRDGITKYGSDLSKISKEHNIQLYKLVQYYHINYNGGNEQTKSLKELEFAYDKKSEKEKKKQEKSAVTTRSKGGNDARESHKNIVQSVLNRQEVDDRSRYDMANFDMVSDEKTDEEKSSKKSRILPRKRSA